MLAFENQVVHFTGTFPNTAAKNASGAGAQDGTEFLAAYVNHDWGWEQDLLMQAQLTPSGITETAAASAAAAAGAAQQMRQAFEMKFGAPGELVLDCIMPGSGTYGAQTMVWGAAAGGPPLRYQYRRVLPCTGQVVLIANYPDLAAAIYCGDANNATASYGYKSTDSGGASRSTSGTYIKLPDFRGVTVRGRDLGVGRDPLAASRGAGYSGGEITSLQTDAFQGHWHSTYGNGGGSGAGTAAGQQFSSILIGLVGVQTAASDLGATETDGTIGTAPRTSKETRMYNASCQIGIRF
jgi:hypothetical protein